jgi:hypothetical protein
MSAVWQTEASSTSSYAARPALHADRDRARRAGVGPTEGGGVNEEDRQRVIEDARAGMVAASDQLRAAMDYALENARWTDAMQAAAVCGRDFYRRLHDAGLEPEEATRICEEFASTHFSRYLASKTEED